MGLFGRLRNMGNTCMKMSHKTSLKKETVVKSKSPDEKKYSYGHKRLESSASTVSGEDIKLVWANNKDSSMWFDQLGAKDIFPRFNTFLENWKVWQDQERHCKEMLGYDVDVHLFKSLCEIPSVMRVGLGYGCKTEEYDFHLDVDPAIQLNELSSCFTSMIERAKKLFKCLSEEMKVLVEHGDRICKDLMKILEHFGELDTTDVELQQWMDNPAQLRQALILVQEVVVTLKSYGSLVTEYIMHHGHNVDIVVADKNSPNPKLIVFPKRPVRKIKMREMDERTFVGVNKGEDDEKYIEISFK